VCERGRARRGCQELARGRGPESVVRCRSWTQHPRGANLDLFVSAKDMKRACRWVAPTPHARAHSTYTHARAHSTYTQSPSPSPYVKPRQRTTNDVGTKDELVQAEDWYRKRVQYGMIEQGDARGQRGHAGCCPAFRTCSSTRERGDARGQGGHAGCCPTIRKNSSTRERGDARGQGRSCWLLSNKMHMLLNTRARKCARTRMS